MDATAVTHEMLLANNASHANHIARKLTKLYWEL